MVKSMEVCGKNITVGELKKLIENIPNDYTVCLSGDSDVYIASYIEVETLDEEKKFVLYAE